MVELIAEIGANHNGELSLAKELLHAAHESGADAVKFQWYQVDDLLVDKERYLSWGKKGSEVKETIGELFKLTAL